eukprot:1150069-Pelagomonas_calceolata.AAC.2
MQFWAWPTSRPDPVFQFGSCAEWNWPTSRLDLMLQKPSSFIGVNLRLANAQSGNLPIIPSKPTQTSKYLGENYQAQDFKVPAAVA